MPESASHKRLVNELKQWITNNYKDNEDFFIWTDSPQNGISKAPIRIEGFVPDVYAKSLSLPRQIIGEAKTARDLDTKHTENQLTAFLRYCSRNEGSFFVLAVPWDHVRYARSLIKYWKTLHKAENVEALVLEKLPS
jgi:hypothetical protein